MAYEEVTSPILTDATGQEIVDQLEAIAQAMQPPTNIDASDVDYDNTQSGLTATDAQAAIDENAANITEIKSNLTDLDTPTDITNDLTPNTGIMTYTTPIANRMGDLVVITVQITPNRQISTFGDLIGNFPIPKNGAEFMGIDTNNNSYVGFYLKGNGVLSNRTATLNSGHIYIIFGSYIAVH